MKKLLNVTLFGLDCVDIERLIKVADICCENFEFAKIKLLSSLPSTNKNVIKIKSISSLKEYSQFMLKEMNDYIDTDFVLIIQHDGFILNPDAWDDSYLNYDYIGAPLYVEGKQIVGNGGFSLRSKKLLQILQTDENIYIDENPDHKYGQHEDWIISVINGQYLENKGIKFAPVELAHKFSFEKNRIFGPKWNGQFGFHGLTWTDISDWIKENPQYGIKNELREKPNQHFD